MIWILLIIIGLIVLIANFVMNFINWSQLNLTLLRSVNESLKQTIDDLELRYIKAECLMNLQNYPAAIGEFESIIESYSRFKSTNDNRDLIYICSKKNLEFCRKPLPKSKHPQNKYKSFSHYLMLNQFGNRRSLLYTQKFLNNNNRKKIVPLLF